MTLVHFDEPDLHVDTDAAGEPCLVSSDRVPFPPSRELRNVLAASELSTAYASNNACFVCNAPITAVRDAAYLVTRDRVVHADRCLAQFLVNTFRFRGRPIRRAIAERELQVAFSEAADEDLEARDATHG